MLTPQGQPALPRRRANIAAFGLAVLALFVAAACERLRDRDGDGGLHPDGWLDEKSADFHGTYLKRAGYPLADCRVCHGEQYEGGAVGSSCATSSCHQQGVESCGTCHGDAKEGRPTTGAHAAHLFDCASCHPQPATAREAQHPNGNVDVIFTGVAMDDGPPPAWDATTQTCSAVYCHASATPRWETPSGEPTCTFCHEAPPISHARWSVAQSTSSCVDCHPSPDGPSHINRTLEVNTLACDACHGSGPLGAPPNALDGSTSASERGVGAHRRHLDASLDDRIGRVVMCAVCHSVPESIDSPGHIDGLAPVDVELPGEGVFDPASGRCVTSCHWDRSPGPQFQDASGAARACDACHGFPPLVTRKGGPHPSVPAGPASPPEAPCLGCHLFAPSSHVDGKVDLGP